MGYTARSTYLKLYDRTASPLFMEWVASRYGLAGTSATDCDEQAVYLDLGCAGGANIQILAPLYPDVKFVGVDINAGHIAQARADSEALSLDNLQFLFADFASSDALPRATYINAHGVYSWLSTEVRRKLESTLATVAVPGALLKLHYSVHPGTQLRENLGHMLAALGGDASPQKARGLLDLIAKEAAGLKMLYSPGFFEGLVKRMAERPDEVWQHDYLNPDFNAEYSHLVMERLRDAAGFEFVASADLTQNILAIQAKKGISDFAAALPPSARHSFMDHVTGRGYRNDVFARSAAESAPSSFRAGIRLGNLWPQERMLSPFMTTQGEVDLRNDACRQIVAALANKPLTLSALQQQLAPMPLTTMMPWIDLLMASSRIEPFLPEDKVANIDRALVSKLNRERVQAAMQTFSAQTSASLLAVELGNCIDVGWFETLVLHHFHTRHEDATQQEMLRTMMEAGISLAAPNGQLASDQLHALRAELAKLERGYLGRLEYWGVEI